MNYYRVGGFLVGLLVLAPLVPAKGQVIIDNFNEYNSGTYIQGSNTPATAQQGTNGYWLRFGTAVTDGIYSSSAAGNGGGTGNRGAVADATYSASATQYLSEFFFYSGFQLSSTGSCTLTLDMKVTTASILPNLQAYLEVQDASGEQYQSAAVALNTDSSYATFSFVFAPGQVTNTINVSPFDSLATVLADATQINVIFKDTVDSGAQSIDFDNLEVAAVPEPRVTMMLTASSLLFLGLCNIRRKARLTRGA